ncbi:MAG: ester cyclase [Candidatus Neomarinimicrobiota bacterium]
MSEGVIVLDTHDRIADLNTAAQHFMGQAPQEAIYAGDKVAGRWMFTGTNTGPGEFPSTGKEGTVSGISIFHFCNGMIVSE